MGIRIFHRQTAFLHFFSTCIFLCLLLSPSISTADMFASMDGSGYWQFRGPSASPAARPEEYPAVIREASLKFGVEPALIKAIIKAESDFDSRAVSGKGAQGLMQIMPETSADLGIKNPFDPKENIFGGVRYFKQMLIRFDHDTRLALAGYNAGPKKVEHYKGIPPYPETITFITTVLENLGLYKSGR